MGRVWFGARSACPPPFLVPVCGVGVRAGPGSRVCPVLLGWVVGVCFLRFFFSLCGVGCWVSLSGGLWSPVPPSHFFRAGLLALFFFRGVCLHVSVSLFPVGCCSWLGVAGFGWVVPLCLFGGPVFGAFWVGGLAASCGVGRRFGGCGLFSRPPPSSLCFFSRGGACLFLPLPSLGWRTHWPAFSVVFRAAVGSCVLFGRVQAHGPGGLCTRWARRPFLPGVRLWLCRLGGCARWLRVALG